MSPGAADKPCGGTPGDPAHAAHTLPSQHPEHSKALQTHTGTHKYLPRPSRYPEQPSPRELGHLEAHNCKSPQHEQLLGLQKLSAPATQQLRYSRVTGYDYMPKTWGERGEKQIRQRVSREGCTGASSSLRSPGHYSTECCAQILMMRADGGRINEKPSQALPAPATGHGELLSPLLCTIKIPPDFNIPLLRPVCLSSGTTPHLHLKTTTKRGTFQQR